MVSPSEAERSAGQRQAEDQVEDDVDADRDDDAGDERPESVRRRAATTGRPAAKAVEMTKPSDRQHLGVGDEHHDRGADLEQTRPWPAIPARGRAAA